jgi:hypothetical protein
MFEASHTAGSPSVVPVQGAFADSSSDGAAADGHAYAQKFSSPYSHRVLDSIGHKLPPGAPDAFAHAIFEVDGAR